MIAKISFFKKISCLIIFLIPTLMGCSLEKKSPDFLLFQSYFPSWLVGGFVAIPITILIRFFLIKFMVDDFLPKRFLVYIGFWMIVTMIFFYINSPR